MKKFGFIFSILILAVVFSAGSAMAQNTHRVNVNIPFEFNFGGKAYAAGHYTVRVRSNSNSTAVVSLSDEAGNDLQTVMAPTNGRIGADKSTLLFDRSNGQVALSGISLENAGYDLPKGSSKESMATKNRREPHKEKGKIKAS